MGIGEEQETHSVCVCVYACLWMKLPMVDEKILLFSKLMWLLLFEALHYICF